MSCYYILFFSWFQDINFLTPVNIIFPISGGEFHYHNISMPQGLRPKLDAQKHFMTHPFILHNVTIRQCSKRKKPGENSQYDVEVYTYYVLANRNTLCSQSYFHATIYASTKLCNQQKDNAVYTLISICHILKSL